MKAIQVISNKVVTDKAELARIISRWNLKSEKIVFTNGCFDLIHQGHIDYLAKAADLGTKLIVGLNTDRSVQLQKKGVNRPIQDEKSRALILAAFGFIDLIVPFEQETPEILIREVKPDVLVKGGDYEIHQIVGAEYVQSNNGLVTTIDFLQGYSTSSIIEKARK